MVEIIDLEDEDESPYVLPRTSKKRTHDGVIRDDLEPHLADSAPEPSLGDLHSFKYIHDGQDIARNSASKGQAVDLESDDGSEEEALDFVDIKEHLCNALYQINEHSGGTFVTSGKLATAVNPGLSVNGLGGIGLPLSEHDAHRIITLCEKRPHDPTEDAISHNSTKQQWTLPVSQFTLRNPAWPQSVSKALDKIAIDLGISTGSVGIRADICSSELYGQGAHGEDACLRPSIKCTKASGMLGTLVIALPSSHTGGSVEARFGTERQELETAPNSDFDISFLSWYQDVGIDIHELTSGYRLLLVCHLMQDEAQTPRSAAGLGQDQQKVIDALLEWQVAHRKRDIRGPVAYMLEQTYEDKDLELNHLKGTDRVRAQLVQQACQDLGFSVFLANIELAVSGSCEETEGDWDEYYDRDDDEHYSIIGEEHRELHLKGVRRLDGSVYVRDVDFEEDNLLQFEVFQEFPDTEEYDGSLKSVVETKNLLCNLLKTVEEVKSKRMDAVSDASPELCQINLERLCKIIVFKSTIYESYITDMIAAAMLLDRYSIFRLVTSNLPSDELPLDAYFKIGLVLPFEVFDPVEWLNEAAQQVRRSKSFHHRWAARLEVLRGAQTSLQTDDRIGKIDVNSIGAWMYSEVYAELETPLPLTLKEAVVLARVVLGHPDSDQFLLHTLLPFVVRNIEKKDFILDFLHHVYALYEVKALRKETVVSFYEDVVRALTQILFEVPLLSKKPKYHASDHAALGQSATPVIDPRFPTDVATLIADCQSLGLGCYVEAILKSVVENCGYYPVETFQGIWIPFLRKLMILSQRDHSLREHGPIFQSVIDTYVRRYLGVRPSPPVITTPVHRGCGCAPCDKVDEFLLDSKRQVGLFSYRESVRKHLEKQLGHIYQLSTDTRGTPYALVVTKNKAEYNAKRALVDYEKRRRLVQETITSIGIAGLNGLLDTKGHELTDFESVRYRLVVAGRIPMAPLQQSINNHIPDQPVRAGKIIDAK